MASGSRHTHLAVLVGTLVVSACGQQLSPDIANRQVGAHFSAGIAVETLDVLSISRTEARARTRIGPDVFDLMFRRDRGNWEWESGRVDDDRWLPAGRFVEELRERTRRERVRSWARAVVTNYIATIRAIDRYSDFLPATEGSPFTTSEWTRTRREMADTLRGAVGILNLTPDERRYQVLGAKELQQTARDAWNQAIAVTLDAAKRQAVFLSSGPDLIRGSADDVVCTVSGTLERSPALRAVRWKYQKQWRLPEGLESGLIEGVGIAANRQVDFSRVVD